VVTDTGEQSFDGIIFACHSDQALNILLAGSGASDAEQAVLGAIRYQKNLAVLHTDDSLLPSKKRAWAAWNYEKTASSAADHTVCLHYWLNKLQPLPTKTPIIVSLNPIRQPKPNSIIQSFEYAHPVFDQTAIGAQTDIGTIQGSRTWFAGAWVKYGFHEDGFTAGKMAAEMASAELNKGS
jgi:predicted NAD/FAD-binding protein